jgi:hypothetical protein
VADLMELFSLCVINAFYVEEIDHHLSPGPIKNDLLEIQDRRNPQTSSKPFLERLRRVSTHRKDLPLTYLMATCPLLVGLLNPDSPTTQAVHELLSADGIASAGIAEQASTTQPAIEVELHAGRSRRKVRLSHETVFPTATIVDSQTPDQSQRASEQSAIYSAESIMCDATEWARINKIYIAGMDWDDQADPPEVAAANRPRRSRKGGTRTQKEQSGDVK